MAFVCAAPTARAPMPELRPQDVIAGAAIPDHPNAYVLGCYDTRITLYSQQVRALELAHALLQAHYVTGGTHAAVIGGGAGGLAMAAALALQGVGVVHLFERGPELMPLQSNARRRRLDPHIYNWPDSGADNEEAELPILDWKSGTATEVRESIVQGFGAVGMAVGDRLIAHRSSRVTGVAQAGRTYQMCYDRDDGAGSLCPEGLSVDLVVLAIGFGLEPTWSIPGVRTESYWRDAGVPGGNVAGRARPGVAVSGNGDGGLIDLVAAT
jgi:NAD(P)-binding Rossmann-like domain